MPCINVSQWGIEDKKVMLIPDYLIPTVGKKEKKKEKKIPPNVPDLKPPLNAI